MGELCSGGLLNGREADGGIDFGKASGSVTRLQIGSFGNADAANALCQKLKVAGRPCFVVEAN